MKEKELVSLEKESSEIIAKIGTLKNIKPNTDWVIFDRSRLAFKLQMNRKKDMLVNDVFQLKELLSFWGGWQPKYAFRPVYAIVTVLGIMLGGGTLTSLAAIQSVPGSPLYAVKINLEKAGVIVAPTNNMKNRLQDQIVANHLDEIQVLADKSRAPLAEKTEKVGQVVDSIQQQMTVIQGQMPNKTGGNGQAIATAKAVSQRVNRIEKAVIQAGESLPAEIQQNLEGRIAQVKETASQTNIQALELMIADGDLTVEEKGEIAEKFGDLIQAKEEAIKKFSSEEIQKNNGKVADKLPIYTVLINQVGEAEDLLAAIKGQVKEEDFAGALQTLKALNEIIKGAEKIVADQPAEGTANATSTALGK
ncbi:MAG: DUF5667 domain-containing protein [Candidatus Portnoybacteria bacterium]|nr:DUF5667 domain-containing protein [Candidatus Portnoybacteria bacterium]